MVLAEFVQGIVELGFDNLLYGSEIHKLSGSTFLGSGRRILVKGFGLVDEHYGDIVSDFIDKLAGWADKAVLCFIELYRAFAFRAGENV